MKKALKIKNAYSESADDPGLECSEILTEQHHREIVDINNIIQKFTQTGYLPNIQNQMEGVYGDFSSGDDFLQSQLKIQQAEEAFMSLDARIRKEFENEPHKLIEFVNNPQNRDRAIELGLISKPITPVKDSLAASEPSKSQTT